MKQIIQSLRNGDTDIFDVPIPKVSAGSLLIKTSKTLISAGTERMLVKFGKAGWIEKARQQPDKVKMVIDKISTDGLKPTIDKVFNKLDQPIPLGYCNVGTIYKIGPKVLNFKIGERVISNGRHAEIVNVPKNLCAKVPNNVSDEEASFTVLGAVALQGIRLAKPTLGEAIVVSGLGLIGLMTVQLLVANGCRVLGLDYDEEKLKLAKKFGAEVVNLNKEDPLKKAEFFSRNLGVDAVIITAATNSNEPIHHAAQMSRKRGRIVLVGVTGLKLSRDDFFKKELTFQVSSSYGPGRYDQNYEEKGLDYPIGFVRWTEQRNFEAVLDMMAKGQLDVKSLISHRYHINEAKKAYEIITSSEPSLGILLTYPGIKINESSTKVSLLDEANIKKVKKNYSKKKINISFIGSGNYASSVLIPAFKDEGVNLQATVSKNGVTGFHAAKKFDFFETTTDENFIFKNDSTDAVVISTQHNSHVDYVLKAMESKKHIFVEKPLCLNLEDLDKIEANYNREKILMIGFNRRFAPQIQKIKNLLENVKEPKAIVISINAGNIPIDHWTQDLEIGGGRIIGEACHFIDLLRFLADASIVKYNIQFMDSSCKDTAIIQLSFADGSIGSINYFANGSKSFPKERVEIFSGGGILKLDNYRKLVGYNWPNFKKMNLWRQDKGQKACVRSFVKSISENSLSPIPVNEIFEVSRVAIELGNH